MVEKTAFDRELALIARWKIDNYLSTADGDELDALKLRMGQSRDPLHKIKPVQHRPARWIQTIATNFFAREFLALEKEGVQSSGGAKRRTGRSGGPAPDDRDIKYFHRASLSKKRGAHKSDFKVAA